MVNFLAVAQQLHHYLVQHHWQDNQLRGPDPGIRLNYRIGRFVKSYLPHFPWRDDLYYLQGQGYWLLGNLALLRCTDDPTYRTIAIACANSMLAEQRPDGAWDYPNPEWRGRVATAEGTWGCLGLIEAYRQLRDPAYLNSVLQWHDYLINVIGFQQQGEALSINYFANRVQHRVPNNSMIVLRFFAELSDVTGDASFLAPTAGLLNFIRSVQKPTGEFPYMVGNAENPSYQRPHFQCFQYNAFACLDLIRYFQLTGDAELLPIIHKVLDFLRTGVASDGHLDYQCGNHHRAVTYHAAAAAATFHQAAQLGIPDCAPLAERLYQYVLSQQRPAGDFLYSRRDYGLLSDRRSYPRYLAMILYHLLVSEVVCVS